METKRSIRARFVNVALSVAAILFVLLFAEPLLRMRYVEPMVDRPVVREVQRWLVLDPDTGYTWKHDVSPDEDVQFNNADIQAPPLCTDEFGVINTPEAIARHRGGGVVDVVGLGDSFMEMAAPDFYRTFADAGLSYYSLAVHRYAPPQYARMFETHGLQLYPRAVVVGLFENDFAETSDYDASMRSGLDWFAFHSGTWCGPPLRQSAFGRFCDRAFAGWQGLGQVIHSRIRGERMSVSGPSATEVDRVVEELKRIVDECSRNGIELWLVLIPSKPTAQGNVTPEAEAFDDVIKRIELRTGEIVDLRPVFQAHPDPLSLYYREDGHWNPDGVALAAAEILKRIHPPTDRNES